MKDSFSWTERILFLCLKQTEKSQAKNPQRTFSMNDVSIFLEKKSGIQMEKHSKKQAPASSWGKPKEGELNRCRSKMGWDSLVRQHFVKNIFRKDEESSSKKE